jgi:hypothetical protein
LTAKILVLRDQNVLLDRDRFEVAFRDRFEVAVCDLNDASGSAGGVIYPTHLTEQRSRRETAST